MNFPKSLRDAASFEVRPDMKFTLLGAAKVLEEAIEALYDDPSTENMVTLNGAWAYGNRVLEAHQRRPDPIPPNATVAKEAKAA